MIPPDVASRLRLVLPDQPAPPQPVTPADQLGDVLSDLVPGQRLMAEIQALLPNGTYRAVVAQRDITLALPFSAKPGDSLELEVVEKSGRLTFAVVTDREPASRPPGESVSTTLSPAGRMIGNLLGSIGEEGRRAQPAPLNGNQPLVSEFPDEAAQLVPVLKEALVRSGMFYESHQARWVAGTLPKEALLQEPQGKVPATPPASIPAQAALAAGDQGRAPAVQIDQGSFSARPSPANTDSPGAPRTITGMAVPAELTPLVQQQLDALASQNFVWQGQIWPGQHMQWEIEDHPDSPPPREDAGESRWRTRLRLSLPHLGTVEAAVQLRGNSDIELSLAPDSESGRRQLQGAAGQLGRQLADAGLRLTVFTITEPAPDGG